MSIFKKLMVNSIDNNDRWLLLENMYDLYSVYNNEQNIPKIIHQVWLGGEMPDKYKRLQQTWIDKNVGWEYKLWTDKDVEEFGLENSEIFNKLTNLGSKSDIFRYEILYRFGGVYVDTDFECVKSFDNFTHLDLFTGTGQMSNPSIFNGLIGCCKENKMIKRLIENIKLDGDNNNWNDIMKMTGPDYFTEELYKYIEENDDKIVVYPTSYFYSFPAVERFKIRNDSEIEQKYYRSFSNEETYAIHLWYTSWQK